MFELCERLKALTSITFLKEFSQKQKDFSKNVIENNFLFTNLTICAIFGQFLAVEYFYLYKVRLFIGIFMVSINAIQSFIKASGVKSILQTKPNVFKGAINPAELKLAKTLKNDTVEFSSKKISSWICDVNAPVAKEGLTNVAGHHNFHGSGSNVTEMKHLN